MSGGAAACFAYNVLADAERLPALLGDWSPTLLCYFATPFIPAPRGRFSYEHFCEFSDYYVAGFLRTFRAVRALGGDLRSVLYPSSSALDELPLEMGEYAAAKSAGEVLCRFLAKAHSGIRIHCPRFPRLATDQTANLLPGDDADPAAIVLAALREMRAAPRPDRPS
jgi:hypothetical protein